MEMTGTTGLSGNSEKRFHKAAQNLSLSTNSRSSLWLLRATICVMCVIVYHSYYNSGKFDGAEIHVCPRRSVETAAL